MSVDGRPSGARCDGGRTHGMQATARRGARAAAATAAALVLPARRCQSAAARHPSSIASRRRAALRRAALRRETPPRPARTQVCFMHARHPIIISLEAAPLVHLQSVPPYPDAHRPETISASCWPANRNSWGCPDVGGYHRQSSHAATGGCAAVRTR